MTELPRDHWRKSVGLPPIPEHEIFKTKLQPRALAEDWFGGRTLKIAVPKIEGVDTKTTAVVIFETLTHNALVKWWRWEIKLRGHGWFMTFLATAFFGSIIAGLIWFSYHSFEYWPYIIVFAFFALRHRYALESRNRARSRYLAYIDEGVASLGLEKQVTIESLQLLGYSHFAEDYIGRAADPMIVIAGEDKEMLLESYDLDATNATHDEIPKWIRNTT